VVVALGVVVSEGGDEVKDKAVLELQVIWVIISYGSIRNVPWVDGGGDISYRSIRNVPWIERGAEEAMKGHELEEGFAEIFEIRVVEWKVKGELMVELSTRKKIGTKAF
jgi:hypothetical protein